MGRFHSGGMKVFTHHGKKIIKTTVHIKKKHNIVHKKKTHEIVHKKKKVIKVLKKISGKHGKHFKIGKFHFIIHHGKITFGKHHMHIVKSTNAKFPASKGYFKFVFHKKVYYMRFHSGGMKVKKVKGKKIIKPS